MGNSLLKDISRCLLFEGIPEEDITFLLDRINYTLIEKKKGEVVAYAGEKCVNAYLLIKGSVAGKLYSPSGQCVRVHHHQAGTLLAPAFLFAKEKKYPLTVEALSDIKLVGIDRIQFDKLIALDNRLMKNLIVIISNKVLALNQRVRSLSFPLKERLWEYINDLKTSQNSDTVNLTLSRQQLAEFLGVQKNSVQRCLGELKKEGLIDFEKRKVKVLKEPLFAKKLI